MKVRVKIDGTQDVLRGLVVAHEAARKALAGALFIEANNVMNESKEIVPVDTGYLRASGYVDLPREGPGGINVEMGYTAPYAIYVHENLNARHAPGKQAKFLEQPLMKAQEGMPERVAAHIQRALKRHLRRGA